MVKRKILLLTLCALFVACIPSVNYNFDISSQFGMTSILKSAYAQTPGDPGNTGGSGNPSDPANTADPGSSGNLGNLGSPSGPDPSAGDNSTNLSNPGDVSSGIGNDTNVTTQNDTSSGPDATMPVAPGAVSNPSASATTQVVPEFGPISLTILVISIVSVIVISSRTRLRF